MTRRLFDKILQAELDAETQRDDDALLNAMTRAQDKLRDIQELRKRILENTEESYDYMASVVSAKRHGDPSLTEPIALQRMTSSK